MTRTIHADGPLYVGSVGTPADFTGLFTVLYGVVVAVSVLSGLLVMAAAGKLAFDHARGSYGGCFGEGRWEETATTWGVVVFLVTGSAATVGAVGSVLAGLTTLVGMGGLVYAAAWVIVWRERQAAAAFPAAASRESAGEQS